MGLRLREDCARLGSLSVVRAGPLGAPVHGVTCSSNPVHWTRQPMSFH